MDVKLIATSRAGNLQGRRKSLDALLKLDKLLRALGFYREAEASFAALTIQCWAKV